MKTYSQKSYPNVKLGNSNDTIANSGCFIVSISNLLEYYGRGLTPPEVNEIGKKCGAFNGALLTAGTLAKALNLSYEKTTKAPVDVCIAETDHYKSKGVPQHFFLHCPLESGRIDPLNLNPKWEHNTYKIVSYRIFNNLIKTMEKEHEKNYKKLAQTLAKFVSYDYGDNPNDDETKEILKKFEKKIKDQKEELKQIDGIAGEYAKQIDSLKIMLKSVEDEYLDTRETISRQDDFVQMQNKKIDELEKEINALKITLDSLREEYSKVVNKLPNKVINEFQLGKWTITISAN
jgi:hypothetical protein